MTGRLMKFNFNNLTLAYPFWTKEVVMKGG